MNPQSLNLPEDLGYTARHVWALKDGDTLVIGITDFAQDQLGEIPVSYTHLRPIVNAVSYVSDTK